MNRSRFTFRLVIYSLLALSFYLGLPAFHYATALMIALILRHRDEPDALFKPVQSYRFGGPDLTERDAL